MPHKILSEYQSKKLFFYNFKKKYDYNLQYLDIHRINNTHDINSLGEKNAKYVIKIDNATKHRAKLGLVQLNKTFEECVDWTKKRNTNDKYYVEHMVKFDDKKQIYIAIRPKNNNFNQIIINTNGGVELENPEIGATIIDIGIDNEDFNKDTINKDTINKLNKLQDKQNDKLIEFLKNSYEFYLKYHLVFLEMNPVVFNTNSNEYQPLDMATIIDTDSFYLFKDKADIDLLTMNYYPEKKLSDAEMTIKDLDSRTGGSLKFSLLNANGSIWTLIAGGGASVVYTDAIINNGYSSELANYGEYSGDPPEDLVYQYCKVIFKLMNEVKKDKKLFIGGGIANFTDVNITFKGVIKALNEIHLHNTTVYVRRGGPNYEKALNNIRDVLNNLNIKNEVYGPEIPITEIVKIGLTKIAKPKLDDVNKVYNRLDLSDIDNVINFEFNENTRCIFYSLNDKAIQRMLDFDYLSGKKEPSILAIINPGQKTSNNPYFWGNNVVLLPVYGSIEQTKSLNYDTVINFMSFRSVYDSCNDIIKHSIINNNKINKIAIIAEGVPELLTRKLNKFARKNNVVIIGPATVGGIIPGKFRIANTGGTNENIIDSKLYHSGSIGLVTRSGGLLNEMCNIISKYSMIHTAISIGGDRYPGSYFIDHVLNMEKNPEIKLIVILGEIGGVQEILLSNLVRDSKITKPIIAYCIGTSADQLSENIQFGHAGASASSEYESAVFKNGYMKASGIYVPKTFERMPKLIGKRIKELKEVTINIPPPQTINANRVLPTFYSSISNDIKDELEYNGVKISNLIHSGIGKTIGHLWFKKDIPDWFAKYIELVLIITADHGAMVSGAHNTIVASRAGKDLVSSLCSGLLTIGPLFGGALNESAKQFKIGFEKFKDDPNKFVEDMNNKKIIISGIGHKLKTIDNPDVRVSILHDYVKNNFPHYDYVKFAFEVEKITTRKRNTLILNVDGFIANSLLDAFKELFSDEFDELIESEFINAFFILGRSIGLMGHWKDQKRLKQGLFRLNPKDIQYLK